MIIELTKVLPIKLEMSQSGKKIPVGGLNKNNRVNYKPGQKNFAIHMSDYPDIVVLDLDTRDHPLDHYINETYTHKTRKGWHCFFRNTYDITSKRQKAKEKFDLLAGENWVFFDYDEPNVAQYTEFNTLPLLDMPPELYDLVKTKAIDVGEDNTTRFTPYPILDILKLKDVGLYGRKKNGKNGWIVETSSELAYAATVEIVKYTDNPHHVSRVLNLIAEEADIDEKHMSIQYLTVDNDGGWTGLIPQAKQALQLRKLVWRPLSDFRAVHVGNKIFYADIDNAVLRDKSFVKLVTHRGVKLDSVEDFVSLYTNVEFMPNHSEKFVGLTYNTFNGFVEPEDGNDHEMFLELCRNALCRGNETYFDYMMDYLAHMVQKPNIIPGVAIVLHGEGKGTGKDTFHTLAGRMFRDGGYMSLTEEFLVGRFNGPLDSCLLGSAEELVFGGSHKEDTRLKTLITSPNHVIERKGVEPYQVTNYIRLVITSNEPRPVKATKGDRRYFVLNPADTYKDNFHFWTKLYDNFNPRHLMSYLLKRDINYFEVKAVPKTEYLEDIVEANQTATEDLIQDWWEATRDGDILIPKELYEVVPDKKWMSQRKFTTLLIKQCGIDKLIKAKNNEYGNHYVVKNHPQGSHEDVVDGIDTPKPEIHDFDADI